MTRLADQIKAIYENEQRSKPPLLTADDLPISYEDITPAWLTAILCKNVPGAIVESLHLGARDTGSSNRRKITVEYNAKGTESGLPTKLFCKATHELANRIVLGVSGGAHCETTFFNHVSPLADIETPRCYFAKYDPRSYNSLIILEDISDKVEEFCSHETRMNRNRVESQLRLLAKLHGRFLDSPELGTVLSTLPTWPEYFIGTQQFGMKEGSNKGFLEAEEVIPARVYRRYDEVWDKTVASAKKHDELPQTFVHNDVHLKNWYCLPNDEMGLGDWQCCSRGHWSRDLAYTIATACTVENRRRWEKELVAYYLDRLAQAGGTRVPFEDAWHQYRQQMLSALTWWTITLAPTPDIPDMQPRDITLEFIRRMATAIDDLDSLDAA